MEVLQKFLQKFLSTGIVITYKKTFHITQLNCVKKLEINL